MSSRRITTTRAALEPLILLAMGTLCGLWAAGTAIGMVIQTDRSTSRIQLNNGAQMRLAPASRATIFQRRFVLEQGQSDMAPPAGYEIEARSLHSTAATPYALARIQLDPARRVFVAAVRGSLQVANSAGVVVALARIRR